MHVIVGAAIGRAILDGPITTAMSCSLGARLAGVVLLAHPPSLETPQIKEIAIEFLRLHEKEYQSPLGVFG
jgi:hypothetical protein